MKKRIEVKTYLIREHCETCGEELKFTGTVLYSYPAKYTHQCPSCLEIYYFEESYPKIEYEKLREEYS